MQEQRVSYDVAILAKEKGVDIKCDKAYIETLEHTLEMGRGGDCMFPHHPPRVLNNGKLDMWDVFHASAPTQALLQKLLREVYYIHFHIYYGNTRKWGIDVYSIAPELEEDYCAGLLTQPLQFEGISTYEEALEIGEKWALGYIDKI